jgi:hypothetical protein
LDDFPELAVNHPYTYVVDADGQDISLAWTAWRISPSVASDPGIFDKTLNRPQTDSQGALTSASGSLDQ